jgi:hypothetical protein
VAREVLGEVQAPAFVPVLQVGDDELLLRPEAVFLVTPAASAIVSTPTA